MEALSSTIIKAAHGNFQALSELAATDQAAILHAILLSPHNGRSNITNKYVGLLDSLAEKGIFLIPSTSAGDCATELLRIICQFSRLPPPKSLLNYGNRLPDRLNAGSLASFAIAATRCRIDEVVLDDPALAFFLDAALLSTARRRNFSDFGLLFLAQNALFPEADKAHLHEWKQRVVRSDGLFGPWDLFAGASDAANLNASVNMMWSTSPPPILTDCPAPPNADRAREGRRPVQAIIGKFACVPQNDLQSAIDTMLKWVDAAIPEFVFSQVADEKEYGDRIKPLVELALALWVIARSGSGQSVESDWAKQAARKVRASLCEEPFLEALRVFPTTILAGLLFPMLYELTGDPVPREIHDLVMDRFSAGQERIPMRQMDYWFMRRLLDANDVRAVEMMREVLDQTLLASESNPCLFSNDSLYDITHAIFYFTHFGMDPVTIPDNIMRWCKRFIPALCASSLFEDDADLGAELLLNWVQLGLEIDERFHFVLGLLISSVKENGAVSGPSRIVDFQKLTTFEQDYHTTLVALVALVGARDVLFIGN